MYKVALFDPALGHSRGHHLAALSVLVSDLGADSVEVYGGLCEDLNLQKMIVASRVSYQEVFSQRFYLLSAHDDARKKIDYIHRLSVEFVQAFKVVRSDIVLLHTVSWEHASALSNALTFCRSKFIRLPSRIIVFAMFNPGISSQGSVQDPIELGLYRSGFQMLIGDANVTCYASCREFAEKYQWLMELEKPLRLHPVFFDNLYRQSSLVSEEESYQILYAGDAKLEKGFDRLVALAQGRLRNNPAARFLIHFSSNGDPLLVDLEREVRAMCEQHTNIKLIEGFVSDVQFDEMLRGASGLVLDYDEVVYREKTSGILWLAVARGIPIEVPRNTWLQREAKSLTETDELVDTTHLFDGVGYREQIFRPFGQWLMEQRGEVIC